MVGAIKCVALAVDPVALSQLKRTLNLPVGLSWTATEMLQYMQKVVSIFGAGRCRNAGDWYPRRVEN